MEDSSLGFPTAHIIPSQCGNHESALPRDGAAVGRLHPLSALSIDLLVRWLPLEVSKIPSRDATVLVWDW